MPERETVRGEVTLERGRTQAALPGHRHRFAVQLEDLAQPPRVEREHRLVRPAQRRHAADDAGAAAEGHERERALRAELEQRAQLLVRARQHHRVGRSQRLAGAQRDQIDIASAGGVRDPLAVVAAHVALAHDVGQAPAHARAQARGLQAHVRQRDRRARPPQCAEALAEIGQGVRRQHTRVRGVPPPPPAHRRRGGAVSH